MKTADIIDQFMYRLTWRVPRLHLVKVGDWSRRDRPVVVLLHGIGVNHRVWRDLVARLDDQPIVLVDLLGFGASPSPAWARYDVADHARALYASLRRAVGRRRLLLCGHSLGSLVAIEYVRRYPARVQRLILCAPPLYRPADITRPSLHEAIVKAAGRRFLRALQLSPHTVRVANHYRMAQRQFRIDPDNLSPFIKTAVNTILAQRSFTDLVQLPPLPVAIVYGSLDATMVAANFRAIQRQRSDLVIKRVVTDHELRGPLSKAAAGQIRHAK